MTLSLTLQASRAQLPIDAACDIEIEATLRNDGAEPVTVYPERTYLDGARPVDDHATWWALGLADCTAVQPQDLRRDHRFVDQPSWPYSYAETLAPGDRRICTLYLCWVPNTVLEPRHLAHCPVSFANASALVAHGFVANLGQSRDDFLRDFVVGFLETPRSFSVRIGYVQEMSEFEAYLELPNLRSEVASVRFEVG